MAYWEVKLEIDNILTAFYTFKMITFKQAQNRLHRLYSKIKT